MILSNSRLGELGTQLGQVLRSVLTYQLVYGCFMIPQSVFSSCLPSEDNLQNDHTDESVVCIDHLQSFACHEHFYTLTLFT